MGKLNAAQLTDERFLASVRTKMGSEVARLREGPVADGTVQGLVVGVQVSRVADQLLPALEPLRTDVARVRPVLGVHRAEVRPQSADQFELAPALVTAVRRFAAAVHSGHVDSQHRRQLEAQSAVAADVRPDIGVRPLVVVPCRALAEPFLAVGKPARKRPGAAVGDKVGY